MIQTSARATLYTPGDSVLHKLNPLTKVMLLIELLIVVFPLMNPFILFVLAGVAAVLAILTGVFKSFLKGMMILIPAAFAMAFFQTFWPAIPPPHRPIMTVGPLTAYHEGLYYGLVFAGRILAMGAFALLIVQVTHPVDLFVSLLKIKIPYIIGFMTLVTLQLIPILMKEATTIIQAQQSRGMKARGLTALIPSMIPLFASSMERVQQLAMSLEARAFGSSGKKTSLREVRIRPLDYVVIIVSLVIMVLSIVYLNEHNWFNYLRTFTFPLELATVLIGVITVGFVGMAAYFLMRMTG